MFSKRTIAFLVVAAVIFQLACSVGGYSISPSNESQDSTSGESESPGSVPTSTPIALGGSTQPAVEVLPPTPSLNLDIPKPQSGTGSIAGRLLWNGEPVVGTEVKLCEEMGMFTGCEGKQFSAVTDSNGIYLLANVTPGEYALVFHAIDRDSWVYVTSSVIKAKKFPVEADKTVVLDDQHLYKYDLKHLSPADKAQVSEALPTLKWEAYPGAAYYEVYLSAEGALSTILRVKRYTGTEITPDQPLLACEYLWQIEAYNAQGVMIAKYDGYSHFIVIDQPVSCYIVVTSPADKAQVSSSDVKLTWEPHPLAAYYKLVVWKDKVGGEKVVDYARIDGATSYTFDQALAPAEYIWSVYAHTSSDDMVAKSPLYYFNVK
jgi:hypothetical protein